SERPVIERDVGARRVARVEVAVALGTEKGGLFARGDAREAGELGVDGGAISAQASGSVDPVRDSFYEQQVVGSLIFGTIAPPRRDRRFDRAGIDRARDRLGARAGEGEDVARGEAASGDVA